MGVSGLVAVWSAHCRVWYQGMMSDERPAGSMLMPSRRKEGSRAHREGAFLRKLAWATHTRNERGRSL